jgi:hypothetical protein
MLHLFLLYPTSQVILRVYYCYHYHMGDDGNSTQSCIQIANSSKTRSTWMITSTKSVIKQLYILIFNALIKLLQDML